jgi:hypothetical protein
MGLVRSLAARETKAPKTLSFSLRWCVDVGSYSYNRIQYHSVEHPEDISPLVHSL